MAEVLIVVKQNIFNKFKQKEITVYEAIKLLETGIDNKKNEGVVYTPKYIADYIIKQIKYHPSETIFEPSSGHGAFLFSLIEYVENHFHFNSTDLKKWFEDKVYACELSYEKQQDLKELLIIFFRHKGINNISFEKFSNEDTLKKAFVNKFDVLIGNPPYIRTQNIDSEYLLFLRKNFVSCEKGNIDIFYAFMELSLRIARRSCMIVPNSFFNNKSALNLRQLIKPYLKSILDFKSELIFSPVRTYTCIYEFSEKTGEDIAYKKNINENAVLLQKKEIDDNQWIFSLNKGKNEKCLSDNMSIRGGIATLRDNLFILDSSLITRINNIEYYSKSFENKVYLIEKESVLDFYKITKLSKDMVIIFPYEKNFRIMHEQKIMTCYPKLYKYLTAIKEELSLRDKGKTEKYDSWFAYGRKQGLQKVDKSHHLLLPIMTNLPIRCTYLNKEDNFLFVSGYVLSFNTKEEAMLTKEILESVKFSEYIKQVGKVWPGKNLYYTYSINHLKNF